MCDTYPDNQGSAWQADLYPDARPATAPEDDRPVGEVPPSTDIEIVVDGHVDEAARDALDLLVEMWAKASGLSLDIIGLHPSNDDGETFLSVRRERDEARAEVARLTVERDVANDSIDAACAETVRLRAKIDTLRDDRALVIEEKRELEVLTERDASLAEAARLRAERDEARAALARVEAEIRHAEDNGFGIEHHRGPGLHSPAVPVAYIRAAIEARP